ncbi:putative transporter [Candidatus Annandia adelgestsuga]|uniref:Putative transporter n=1 Tax=Candidatus Annandia adelgestsuga TaxID=1302411 RepID=A0A3S9J7M5_9ENTR|nr:MFS transporter TsgA [Candidatus Annandia adelgestsuga]AZP36286.1 putative transporter [Candidatus Annandia adelgestsuga]
MLNIKKLTLISFLMYYFTGSLTVTTGNIIDSISKYFNVSISNMSFHFSFLSLGILIAMIVNNYIRKIIIIKNQIIFSFYLIIISIIILIINNHNINIFSFCVFLFGFVGGISLSIGTFLITNIYDNKKRSFFMLITDSFFSIAGIIFPFIISFFVVKKINFIWIYSIISFIYLIIFYLTLITNFNEFNKLNKKKNKKKKRFKIENILLFLSSLFYISAQCMFVSWIPIYIKKYINNINYFYENKTISIFWFFYMLGMWFFSYISKKFDIQKILIFLTFISSILVFIFLQCKNINLLNFIISLIGFFSSSIYTIIITLSSMQTKKPYTKFINLTLIFGTTGSFITLNISYFLLSSNNTFIVLCISNILYFIVFIINIILLFFTKHNKFNNYK